MAQVVEAWLVADGEALSRYYGQGFLPRALPRHSDIEQVDKRQLLAALEHATRQTQKGRYHKIAHCSELLARLSPENVRHRAAHCERLFATLLVLIEETVSPV